LNSGDTNHDDDSLYGLLATACGMDPANTIVLAIDSILVLLLFQTQTLASVDQLFSTGTTKDGLGIQIQLLTSRLGRDVIDSMIFDSSRLILDK
jgi:hypothetical protein